MKTVFRCGISPRIGFDGFVSNLWNIFLETEDLFKFYADKNKTEAWPPVYYWMYLLVGYTSRNLSIWNNYFEGQKLTYNSDINWLSKTPKLVELYVRVGFTNLLNFFIIYWSLHIPCFFIYWPLYLPGIDGIRITFIS